ncbi:hypothetical protein LJ221_21555, partial [Streptomyces sp. CNQ085]|nr:hypothetical protein [Streptomyces sp. CNQ085]
MRADHALPPAPALADAGLPALLGRAAAGYACGAALGYLLDLIAGDPRRAHPVAAFGRAASSAERLLWRDHRGAGALYTA